MRNKNTMSKGVYLFENVFWSAIAMIWYRCLLFRCVNGMSYFNSAMTLWALTVTSVPLGMWITWGKRRNRLNIFVNVSTPFVIYTLIAYFHNFPALVWTVGAVAAVLAAVYSALTLTWRIRDRADKGAVIVRRIIRSALGARTIVTCCMSLLILCLGVGTIFGGFLFSPNVRAERKSAGEEMTAWDHIEVVSRLDEEVWAGLSTREKLDTLQTVANIEAYDLGLPHELNVRLDNLPETTLARYDDRTRIIAIDIDHFDSDPAKEVLDSVCHEAYHAYQHRLCDAYDSVDEACKGLAAFCDVTYYKQEFSRPAGREDYDWQQCEVNARHYARAAVETYYIKINAYLGKDAM